MIKNPYQRAYPRFEETPKAVIAAVAYSLARRLSDDDQAATDLLLYQEWITLHANGIVTQEPPWASWVKALIAEGKR